MFYKYVYKNKLNIPNLIILDFLIYTFINISIILLYIFPLIYTLFIFLVVICKKNKIQRFNTKKNNIFIIN